MAPKRKVVQQLPVIADIPAPEPEPSNKRAKTVKPTQVCELVSLISAKTGTTVAQSRAFLDALRDVTIEELGPPNRVVKIPSLITLKVIPLPAKEVKKKTAFGKVVTTAPKPASVRIRFVENSYLLSALKQSEAAA